MQTSLVIFSYLYKSDFLQKHCEMELEIKFLACKAHITGTIADFILALPYLIKLRSTTLQSSESIAELLFDSLWW